VRIWDISGQSRYHSLTKNLYKQIHLIILVYSVTDKDSFNNLEGWLEEVKKVNQNAKFLLVGNKIDYAENERAVTIKDGSNFANKHNMEFFVVSAKKGTYISDELFSPFIKKFLEEEKKKKDFSVNSSAKIYGEKTNSSFRDECCSCCSCFKKSEELD
jgi:GTPase SAR1 family protein